MASSIALRFVEGDLLWYRRIWLASALSSFLQPILFLAAMGMGPRISE